VSEVAIRAQIKTIMEGVSGMGIVHDYVRWASTWEKFLEFFKTSSKKINGATITRVKTPEECESSNHNSRRHRYLIRLYYGLKDDAATEITFQLLVENTCAAFRAKRTLNDTAEDSGPPQVEVVELRMFGSVLCHYGEISLEAEEFEDWS